MYFSQSRRTHSPRIIKVCSQFWSGSFKKTNHSLIFIIQLLTKGPLRYYWFSSGSGWATWTDEYRWTHFQIISSMYFGKGVVFKLPAYNLFNKTWSVGILYRGSFWNFDRQILNFLYCRMAAGNSALPKWGRTEAVFELFVFQCSFISSWTLLM